MNRLYLYSYYACGLLGIISLLVCEVSLMIAIFFGGSLWLALFGVYMTLVVGMFYTLFYLLKEELEKQAEAAGDIFC